MAQETRPHRLYRNNGDGTFTDVAASAGVNNSGPARGVAWADYNNDGYLDLYVANADHYASVLYRNNGDGTFTNVTTSAGIDNSDIGRGVTWGDYDNDGDLDLFLTNQGANHLYRNNGNGTFTAVTSSAGVGGSGFAAGAVWGDYDNDEDLDLVVTYEFGGIQLYRNNGDGTFTNVAGSAGVNDNGAVRAVGWADYDNDGFLDLYLAHNDDNASRLYHNNGNGTFTEVGAAAGVNDTGTGSAMVWGDYNNDGNLDLFVAHGSSPSRLYRNNGTSNRWLAVKLVGTLSNKSGIGAQVTAVIGSTRQRRDVDGGSGFLSPPMPVAFGFSGTTTVDSLIISWPSGIVQKLTQVATNQILTVTEPSTPPPRPIELALDHAPGPRGGIATVSVTLRNPNAIPAISVNALQFQVMPGDPDHIHFDHIINTVGDIGFEIDAETIDGVTTVVIHPNLVPLTDAIIPPGQRLVCQLVYRVDETLSDGTVIPLHVDQIVMSDAFGGELPSIGQDGSITVGERRGDLTHDGNVNVRDLVLLIRMLLGKDPYPAPGTGNFFVADANGDGAINVADAVSIINVILHRVSKPIADGPTSPAAVSLGDLQTLESGQLVIPMTVQSDGVIAGVQATLTFDPVQLQIGAPQLTGRAIGMTVMHQVSEGTLRLVVYSLSGQGIVAGHGPAFLIPVTVLDQSETSPTLTLSQVVLANHQAQTVPVALGTNTVKVAALPVAFALKANRPNPFNPTTRIAYEVPQHAQTTLAVYNLLGQEVVRLVDGVQTPGRYVVTWDGRNAHGQPVASGVYLYRLTTSTGFTQARRMTLLK